MWKSEFAAFFLAAFLFTSGSCIGRECHTCNSHSNVGCDKENFHPVEITTEPKGCQASFNQTFQSFQALFFNHYREFPTELMHRAVSEGKEVCAKFTIVSKDHSKSVTFRGCSTLGQHTCTILRQISSAINTTTESCHECDNKEYCNHGVSVVISYLVAALALLINYKF